MMNCLLVNCHLHGEGKKNFYDMFCFKDFVFRCLQHCPEFDCRDIYVWNIFSVVSPMSWIVHCIPTSVSWKWFCWNFVLFVWLSRICSSWLQHWCHVFEHAFGSWKLKMCSKAGATYVLSCRADWIPVFQCLNPPVLN